MNEFLAATLLLRHSHDSDLAVWHAHIFFIGN